MILWKKDVSDSEAIRDRVSEAYKIENPDKVQGYAGYFNFHFGEIRIDEAIAKLIEKNSEFEKSLEEFLRRFSADDYGDITQDEKESNAENKYFFGCFVGLEGRYATPFGVVNIKIIDSNNTHITIGN